MRNKDLFLNKIERVERRLKSIEMLLTRRDATATEFRENFAVAREQLDDLRTMVQREN